MSTKGNERAHVWGRGFIALWVALILGAFFILVSTSVDAKKTVVSIATWNQDREGRLKRSFAPYIAEKHPDIEIRTYCFPYSDYDTKLLTIGGSDIAPDIFEIVGGRLFEYVIGKLAVNLDPYVKRDLNMSDYFPNPWNEVRYPYRTGSLYAIPYTWVASLLYYNRDAFDAVGIDYPNESWDWTALRNAAQKLTRDTNADGRVDQWGFGMERNGAYHNLFDPMVYAFGGEVLNAERTKSCINNPGAEAALQFLVDMIHVYKVVPPPGIPASFQAGFTAMWITLSTAIDQGFRQGITKFEWDVAIVPKGPHSRVIYGGSNCWAVMKRPGQDMEKVWTVMKELISEEGGLTIFLTGGYGPVLKNISPSFLRRWLEKDLPPRNKKVLLETAPYMRDADWSLGWMQWQQAKDAEIAKALAGKCSVKEALRAAEIAINRVFQRVFQTGQEKR